jgi:hypothetical protein
MVAELTSPPQRGKCFWIAAILKTALVPGHHV